MSETVINQLIGRRDWTPILVHAAAIVHGYDTGVTLRQLFYRLVSDGTLKNTRSEYTMLAQRTAEGRREGTFPDLIDQSRRIHRYEMWEGIDDALLWLQKQYWRQRTEGQPYTIVLGAEKTGLVEQLMAWFGERGLPIVAIGGWAGQAFVDEIIDDVEEHDRPAVLLYAGDLDASGEAIETNFLSRTDCWQETRRIALTLEQVEAYELPMMPGKDQDSRNKGFIEKYGELFQVEVDALKPEVLRVLFQIAIDEFWDDAAYQKILRREKRDQAALAKLATTQRRRRG